MGDHQSTPGNSYPAYRQQENEFSLYSMLLAVKDGWRVVVPCALAGLLFGGSVALLVPEKFEADAHVQVATFANQPVESPASLAERMKLPLFYPDQVHEACGLATSPTPGEDLVSTLQPVVNRAAPLVGISYIGSSVAEAERCLGEVLNYVRSTQAALADPVISVNKTRLAELRQRFAEAQQLDAELSSRSVKLTSQSGDAAIAGMLLSTRAATKEELNELRAEISKLEIALSPTQTRPAQFATPIHIKAIRTKSKRVLYVISAAMAGLFLGAALVLTRSGWRNFKRGMQAGSHDLR